MSVLAGEEETLLDRFEAFYKRYYADEIAELAQNYPNDKKSLTISFGDLLRFDAELADDMLAKPEEVLQYAEEALRLYDLPIDVSLSNAHVRLTGLNEADIYGVEELRSEHRLQYVGVRGKIEQITEKDDLVLEAAFECQRCGTMSYVPQAGDDFQEPYECQGCERQGPFQINFDQSEFVDFCKLQLKQPPEDTQTGQGASIEVHVKDDLVDFGGEHGLQGHVGEEAIVNGVVKLNQKGSGRKKTPLFERYLNAYSVEFVNAQDEAVDVEEHREAFEAYASGDNPYWRFAKNIAPGIKPVGDWEKTKYLGAAYLFGSPRINPVEGAQYRGDFHFALIGDPGLGKTAFLDAIAELSPKCERRSGTGIKSEVGLTAAAVQDDFGGSQWSLKPGILVRANNGHAIISEIDKAPPGATKIHDAIERDQVVTVDKAGIKATLKTRTALLVDGNPQDGRFDKTIPPAKQLGIDPALLSRFDAIAILIDVQDDDQDGRVAEHILSSYRESAALEKAERRGESTDDIEQVATNRDVSVDEARAWVKYARENIFPELTPEVEQRLKEFYVDVRGQNTSGEIVATARKLESGIRMSSAFARLRLSETVSIEDAELAIDLSKWMVGKAYDKETGNFHGDFFTEAATKYEPSQEERVSGLWDIIYRNESDYSGGVPVKVVKEEAMEELDMSPKDVDHRVEKLKQKGEVYEPTTDNLQTT